MSQISKVRKAAVLVVFYIDTVLHGVLIIGWSSIRQILENEGFFLNCDENQTYCENEVFNQRSQISHIFQLTMMLAGPIMFLLSLVNDNVGYGVQRSIAYLLLSLCYFLLAVSTPTTPMLQYVWILHHPVALFLVQSGFTLCSFCQNQAGLLINLGAGLLSASSLIPQAWLSLINQGLLTRSHLFYIWCGLTLVSLIITTFLFPWHSITDPDFAPNFIDVVKRYKL